MNFARARHISHNKVISTHRGPQTHERARRAQTQSTPSSLDRAPSPRPRYRKPIFRPRSTFENVHRARRQPYESINVAAFLRVNHRLQYRCARHRKNCFIASMHRPRLPTGSNFSPPSAINLWPKKRSHVVRAHVTSKSPTSKYVPLAETIVQKGGVERTRPTGLHSSGFSQPRWSKHDPKHDAVRPADSRMRVHQAPTSTLSGQHLEGSVRGRDNKKQTHIPFSATARWTHMPNLSSHRQEKRCHWTSLHGSTPERTPYGSSISSSALRPLLSPREYLVRDFTRSGLYLQSVPGTSKYVSVRHRFSQSS